MRNKRQIPKQIETRARTEEPRVFLSIWQSGQSQESAIISALQRIASMMQSNSETVFILGRYKLDKKPIDMKQIRHHAHNGLKVEYMTAHGSKGREADHVIITGMTKERLGFPSGMVDDPLHNLVIEKPEEFEHAEERRLFYVSLTRARESVHIVAPLDRRSQFVDELVSPPDGVRYELTLEGDLVDEDRDSCPDCESGYLEQRDSKYGPFWGCSNYPYCGYKKKDASDRARPFTTTPRWGCRCWRGW
jgi:DNA helicase-4